MVSHFVLRLAYCRTDELRRWLLTQECALFRYRFNKLLPSEKACMRSWPSLPPRRPRV
jgi:DNA primase large subunit